eukprot:jgi/Chlat1/1698/Chrsp127S01927
MSAAARHFIGAFCEPPKHFTIKNLFGKFTPCFTEIVVLGSGYFLLVLLSVLRLRLLYRSQHQHYRICRPYLLNLLIVIAVFCTITPLLQLNARISSLAYSPQDHLAPYELVSYISASVAWCLATFTLHMEKYRHVKEETWYLRFGVLYLMSGQLAKLRFVLIYNKDYGYFFWLYVCYVVAHVMIGLALLCSYVPGELTAWGDSWCATGYLPLQSEPVPAQRSFGERRANILSQVLFSWMTPIMKRGFKAPLRDVDIPELEKPDQARTLSERFDKCWEQEHNKERPSLIRALWHCWGAQFMLGGAYKVFNDAAQFVGPVVLKLLLQAVQNGEPHWKGYSFAAAIFLGQMVGALAENQYFQIVMRVGFQVRSALVSAIFRKTLHLSHAGRDGVTSGKVTNLITSDAESLQMLMQNLHQLWSAPLRIIISMVLLYNELGIASILSLGIIVLMIPVQACAIVIRTVSKLVRSTLMRTDERVKLMNEILNAMDIVKFFAWEDSFKKKINDVRGSELSWLRKSSYLVAVNYFILGVVPVLVSVATFAVYSLMGNQLTAAKAFTALALFGVLRMPLFTFPNLISQVTSCKVSIQRLQDVLGADERKLPPFPSPDQKLPAIKVENGNFSWTLKATKPTLQNVSLEVMPGQLVCIVGSTGQGKSSLLAALLGEMPELWTSSGDSSVTIHGRVAYVPQTSWIFNATVRENILFGLPFEPSKYDVSIHASELDSDLSQLQGGDLTEIGERGVNVSGGQKQRIAIARAVYSDADVYMFDDPLSALDAHVGREVFENCLAGVLKHKTRLLVTNQLQYVPRADLVIVMSDGTVSEYGTYSELMSRGTKLASLMQEVASEAETEAQRAAEPKEQETEGSEEHHDEPVGNGEAKDNVSEKGKRRKETTGTVLVAEEEQATGTVSMEVLMKYGKAMGGFFPVTFLLSQYVWNELARVAASVWLSYWAGQSDSHSTQGVRYFLGIYALLSLLQVVLTLVNQFYLALVSLSAAQRLHQGMLNCILRVPMAFFHANPVGRIINRFTKDTADVDKNLANFTSMFLRGVSQLVSTYALIAWVTPFITPVFIPVLFGFYFLYLYFQRSAREMKRIDAVTRSPVYSQFGEALAGLTTIRAYRAQGRVLEKNALALDRNIRLSVASMSANRWLSIRLEFLGSIIILATALLAVVQNGQAATIGLTLSYALSITALMNMTLRLGSVAETSFNAVERVSVYSELPPEAPLVIKDRRPPPSWPLFGKIDFEDVHMRYRSDLPPVLKGLTATINASEKVGVVGRTGAGKSSLFNALFRIVELDAGRIIIDNEDIHKFGLADVRRNLSIIPQTPVLFTGTLRFNLDPFGEHTDHEIWQALDRAHLKDLIAQQPAGLDFEVKEGGDNFSVGQRQLLNLARALLRHTNILVLDEATAAVDVFTDALIQKTIREEFAHCTMLIIAHRLNTIMDCDKVMVLSNGVVLEYDTPANLLSDEDGAFTALVKDTGPATERLLREIAYKQVDLREHLEEQVAKSGKFAATARAVGTFQTLMRRTRSERELTELDRTIAGSTMFNRVREAIVILREALQSTESESVRVEIERLELQPERWATWLVAMVRGLAQLAVKVQEGLSTPIDDAVLIWGNRESAQLLAKYGSSP